MCTLIVGRDVLSPGSVLLAANRDEDPARPSDPPGLLRESPRLVGGRDRRAGGTWLAVRERQAAVAVLNRGPGGPPGAERRSRGLLVLDVAAVSEDFPAGLDPAGERRELLARLHDLAGPGLPFAALCRAFAALWEGSYAPFTLLFASPGACWTLALEAGGVPRAGRVSPGWHVLTHAELDDPREPRTARLLEELAGFAPRSVEKAEQRLGDLLRSHGDPASGVPPVCLHEGRMVTVSASTVWLASGEARYRHAEGRPCERALEDRTALLAAPSRAGRPA